VPQGNGNNEGGGIYLSYTGGAAINPRITGNVIADNSGYWRTALATGGAAFQEANFTLEFERNRVAGNQGTLSLSQLVGTAVNNEFIGNDGDLGGGGTGILITALNAMGLTLANNTLTGGHTQALLVTNAGSLTLVNNIFAGHATGVYENDPGADAVPLNNLFYGNTTDFRDENAYNRIGADAINLNVAGAFENIGGDPGFVPGVSYPWTAGGVYTAATFTTLLTDTFGIPGACADGWVAATSTRTSRRVWFSTSQPARAPASPSWATPRRSRPAETPTKRSRWSWQAAPGRWSGAGRVARACRRTTSVGMRGPVPTEKWTSARTRRRTATRRRPKATRRRPTSPDFDAALDARRQCALSRLRQPEAASPPSAFLPAGRTGAFTQYGGTYTSSPIAFTAVADGVHQFYTIATDNNGNTEAAPGAPDAETLVLTSFAGSVVYVDQAATASENGSSWTDAVRLPSQGLLIAQGFSVPQVWVADGTYADPIILVGGTAVYGGFQGTETQLSQRDPAQYVTTINGGERCTW